MVFPSISLLLPHTKVCFDAQCSVSMEETLLDFKCVMQYQVIFPPAI